MCDLNKIKYESTDLHFLEGKPMYMGKTYLVRRNRIWHRAKVLQGRLSEQNDNEYFVHYIGYNEHVEEWVSKDRVKFLESRHQKKTNLEKTINSNGSLTRIQKRRLDQVAREKKVLENIENFALIKSHSDIDAVAVALEKKYKAITESLEISQIQFGNIEIDTCYNSQYPKECTKESKLYICEYCYKYMRFEITYRLHKTECTLKHPPGKEIYECGTLKVFEVDEDKAPNVDVKSFLFYILTDDDENGTHTVGYFSKAKESSDGNNLSCILILPPYQKRGLGQLLIGLSYELSRREGKVGCPEEPISDLGLRTYKSYWTWVVLRHLCNNNPKTVTTKRLSVETSIREEDIISTLKDMDLVKFRKGRYVINATSKKIEAAKNSSNFNTHKWIFDPSAVRWSPPK